MNTTQHPSPRPRVSILVPVYGVEKYIAECAESLFSQTYRDIEYVFVDDRSPDDSIAVMESVLARYPERKPYVQVVHHDHNKGLGGARCTALSMVRTDYFTIVDSDDVLPLNAIEILVRRMQQTDTDIVDGAYAEYSNGQLGMPIYAPHDEGSRYADKVMCQNLVSNRVWGRLYKNRVKELLGDMFVEGIDYAEDYCANARIAVLATRSWTDEVVYHYRVDNQQSYTKQMSDRNIMSYLRANRRVLSFHHRRGHLPFALELAMLNAYRVVRGRTQLVDEEQQYVPQHLRAQLLYSLFHSSVPYAVTDFVYRIMRTVSCK